MGKTCFAAAMAVFGILISFGASAQTTDQSTEWNRFFDGDPSGLSQDWTKDIFDHWASTDKPFPYLPWIRGYQKCKGDVDHLATLLQSYDQKFRGGDEKSSGLLYDQVNGLLKQPQDSSCVGTLQRAYFVTTISLGPVPVDHDAELFYRNDLILFAVYLANNDVITALTPDLRNQFAAGKASLWTEKKGPDYLLSGAYNCQKSKIYLSSTLRPFNAAASLSHEIDHLYRDKVGYESMSDWVKNKDVRSFVISDEFLASLYGAFYQRNLYLMDHADPNGHDYTSQGDEFNLFAPRGTLSELMDHTGLGAPTPFYEFHGLIAQDRNDPWVHDKLCEIDKLIRNGYFHHDRGECNLDGIFPQAAWFTTESYLDSLRESRRDPTRFNELMEEFEQFNARLGEPSPVCVSTLAAEKGGVLDDYIGSELGGHPGNVGVKPCLRVRY